MTLRWGITQYYRDRCHTVLPDTTVSMCTQGLATELVMDDISEHRPRLRICPECAIAAVGHLYAVWPSPRPRGEQPEPAVPDDWFGTADRT